MIEEPLYDRTKDRIMLIAVDSLPVAFQDKIDEYGLCQDGYWRTFAPNAEVAQKQTASMIKLICGLLVDPTTISVVGRVPPRKGQVRWTGRHSLRHGSPPPPHNKSVDNIVAPA